MESAKRIRIAFASACPDADLLRAILLALKPAPTQPAAVPPKPRTQPFNPKSPSIQTR
jgi:hypothetical protein